jgi:hypothetical protein
MLLRNSNQVLTRSALLNKLWEFDEFSSEATIKLISQTYGVNSKQQEVQKTSSKHSMALAIVSVLIDGT